MDRKQRIAPKYAICFRGTVLAPGLSLPPPSRAPVGVSPQMQICQGHKNTCCPGDLVLGLVEAWPQQLVPRNAAGQALSFGPGYWICPFTCCAQVDTSSTKAICYEGSKTHCLGPPGEGHMKKGELSNLRIQESRSWPRLCVTLGNHLTPPGPVSLSVQ